MSSHPIPIVIISSAFHPGESELSFKALEAGALTILPPPHGPGHVDFVKSARKLNTTLKLLAEVKVVRRSQPIPSSGPSAHREAQPAFTAPLQKTPPRFQGKSSTGILAIGASAGGPSALQTLFSGIDSTIPVPVIVVQHIEKGFAQGFAEWLGTHSTIPVRIAGDGEKMIPGVVYLPPGDYHISVREPGTIALSKGIPQNGLRPAVDVLFQSVARIYGPAAAGILLSGMGKDGASGLLSMKESGSFTLAQDEVSSLVFGMPGEAIRIGAACSVCPPDRMSRLIMHYFSETNSTKP